MKMIVYQSSWIMDVGAAIRRPPRIRYEFVLDFSEYERLYRTGVVLRAANQNINDCLWQSYNDY